MLLILLRAKRETWQFPKTAQLVQLPYLPLCRLCKLIKMVFQGASLVAQWLRICLPMQGTRVRALVWEDPTCRGATGPVSHNY